MYIQREDPRSCPPTHPSTYTEFCIHSFVTSHFQDLVAKRIAPDAGNECGRNTDLGQMRRHIERRAARVFARRQAIPQDFAKSVKLSRHDLGAATQSRPVRK